MLRTSLLMLVYRYEFYPSIFEFALHDQTVPRLVLSKHVNSGITHSLMITTNILCEIAQQMYLFVPAGAAGVPLIEADKADISPPPLTGSEKDDISGSAGCRSTSSFDINDLIESATSRLARIIP